MGINRSALLTGRAEATPAFIIRSLRRSALTAGIAAATIAAGLAPADAQLFWPSEHSETSNRVSGVRNKERRLARRRVLKENVIAKEIAKETAKPVGPLLVAISIDKQQLKLYDRNGVFAESPISSGTRSHPTPMGVFSIIQRSKYHRSNIYSGAPMPYMQRITWSGVAMHAGVLPGYPASHGCIRMPMSFATRMWGWTKMGARVVIAPGEVSLADFSHPRLIARKSDPVLVATAAEVKDVALPPKPEKSSPSGQVADASGELPPSTTEGSVKAPAVPGVTADAAKQASAKDITKEAVKDSAKPAPKRTGHIAAYVSGKTGKLYVRQDFEPLFEVPVTIATADRPLGTHVFTARADAADANALSWTVVSMPTAVRREAAPTSKRKETPTQVALPPSSPAEALDRIAIPDDAMQKIAAAIAPGGSLVISDQGLGDETGLGTDFIVPLR